MKVTVLSPTQGGPCTWAKNLVYFLNSHTITANHVFDVKGLILSPFFRGTDIIHAAVPVFHSIWGKPIVLTIKGDFFREKRTWKIPYRLAIKNADVITTPSIFLKNKLNLRDAHVIPNAIYAQNYEMTDYSDGSTIDLITVTNFAFKDKSEGVLNILKNIEEIRKSTDKKISYTVVGGGPFLQGVINAARDSKISVQFTGHVSKPGVLLQKSDIFVYDSLHDNFPNVILEAMASGLPVITNNVGAVEEMIDRDSSGFIAADNEEYQKFLFRLISDPALRETTGREARKTAGEKFDWNRIGSQYITIYEDLLSSS